MATAVDTNILVAFWQGENDDAVRIGSALENAAGKGGLVICGAVFAELLAYPNRKESFIYDFCSETNIIIDWNVTEEMWLLAGKAFQAYNVLRRRQKAGSARRILADFLIGAHAVKNNHQLLTLDSRIYQTTFPNLQLIRI